MRYIAQQRITVTSPGSDTPATYEPGERIAEFGAWPAAAQNAMLFTHQVAVDTRAVLEDGTCATCGQSVEDRKRPKGKA